MHLHLTLELQEILNDIFPFIMFLFWIQFNHLSKLYVAFKRDPYQTLSSIYLRIRETQQTKHNFCVFKLRFGEISFENV